MDMSDNLVDMVNMMSNHLSGWCWLVISVLMSDTDNYVEVITFYLPSDKL